MALMWVACQGPTPRGSPESSEPPRQQEGVAAGGEGEMWRRPCECGQAGC